MRPLVKEKIADAVKRLLVQINTELPLDVCSSLIKLAKKSTGTSALMMADIIKNAELARERQLPLCQDTGMVIFFVKLGIKVALEEPLQDTLSQCVGEVYRDKGYRPSVVSDPLERKNTGDNTPALVYVELIDGDKLELEVMVKGFGSENMSATAMLTPAHGYTGVKDFVLATVTKAGGNPCPPIIVGVGVGGTFEYSAYLSKRALLRPVGLPHVSPIWAEREVDLLRSINALDIGPGGAGGGDTALAVNIEYAPTHIAGLPVSVNILCHSARHGRIEI